MCIQWTRNIYSVLKTRQSNPSVSKFSRWYNEFTSVQSVFPCNNRFLFCVLFQGAALLGGVNALHTAFPDDPEKEYIVQGRWGV